MSDLSRHEADRPSRLARAAAVCCTNGEYCPAERATQLFEAIIKPGDRVAIEGDNQKPAEFPQPRPFLTLSPVPGFRGWLTQPLAEESKSDTALLPKPARDDWRHDPEQSELLRAPLMRLRATDLTPRASLGNRIDPGRVFTSAKALGLSGSTGSATPCFMRSRNPSASWSPIFATTPTSRTNTRP